MGTRKGCFPCLQHLSWQFLIVGLSTACWCCGSQIPRFGSEEAIAAIGTFLVELAHLTLPAAGQTFFEDVPGLVCLPLFPRAQEETNEKQADSNRKPDNGEGLDVPGHFQPP